MSSRTTKDIVCKFAGLPEAERQDLIAGALAATSELKWLPPPERDCFGLKVVRG